jgi:HK97 family phage portal protein
MNSPLTWLSRLKERFQAGSLTSLVPTWQENHPLHPIEDFSRLGGEGYRQSSIIFSCIREISTSAAEPTLRVYAGEDPQTHEPTSLPNDPLLALLTTPNPAQSSYEFLETLVTHLHVTGNAYVHKVRSRQARVVELQLLRPDRVRIVPGAKGLIAGYQIIVGGRLLDTLRPEDVIQFKFPDVSDDYYGLSPLAVAARTVDLDQQAIDFLRAIFLNRGVPAGLLKLQSRVEASERRRIKEQWVEEYGGFRGWHRLAVLDGGAEYQDIGMKLAELNLDGVLSETEARICSVLGCPPIVVGMKIGLERSTMANYQAAVASFWRETLNPLYVRLGATLTRGLGHEFGPARRIAFDLSTVAALQEDAQLLRQFALEAWDKGLMTRNQSLQLIKQPEVEGGDVYKITNSVQLVPVGEMPQPPAPVVTPNGDGNGQPVTSGNGHGNGQEAEQQALEADWELLAPAKSRIQTVILSKDQFPTAAEAKAWLSAHEFKSALDETEGSFRARQFSPSRCQPDSYATITLTTGVKAAICTPQTSQQALIPLESLAIDLPLDDEVGSAIHQIADRLAPELRRDFLAAVAALREQIDEARLLTALQTGDVEAALQAIPVGAFAETFAAVEQTLVRGAVQGANAAAAELEATLGVTLRFDLLNPQAVAWARSYSGQLITQISEETRAAVRELVARAFEQGVPPASLARQIKPLIGLTRRQAQAVDTFRATLTEAGATHIDDRVERYAAAQLRQRSVNIARTETLTSAANGTQMAWETGAAQGFIDRERARRHWVVAWDDRLCLEVCEPIPGLNPDGVKLDEPFQTPIGPLMTPTAHPSCRCALALRFLPVAAEVPV